jgi:opacity protein-like surface antigen
MKNILLVVVGVIFVMTIAHSQEEHKASLLFGCGVSFPSQPELFSDYWDMGFNLNAGFGFHLSPRLTLEGTVEYNNFAFDDEQLLNDLGASGYGITIEGGSATIFSVLAGLKANLLPPDRPVSPYFIGDIGVLNLSTDDVTVSAPGVNMKIKGDSESAFTMVLGAGVDITAGESTTVFLQIAYGLGFTEHDNTNYVPLKAGLRVNL